MDPGPLLNTLLHEVKDAVIVCDSDARLTLFNQAAELLLGQNRNLSIGGSLYDLCLESPVAHAIGLLQFQHVLKNQPDRYPYVQFMNASINRKQFFRCRLSLLPPLSDADSSFVLILEDISAWYVPDNPLFMKIEDFRAPLTNLRAAIENLTEYPEMSPVMRSAFENVLVQEAFNLTEAFNALAGSCRVIMQTQSHLAQLDTELLFGYVAHHLQSRKIPVAAKPDRSVGVKVDIYGFLQVLDYLVASIKQQKKGSKLSCRAHIGEQFTYFDFIWSGPFITTAAVAKMLERKLEHSIGRMSASSILRSMDADVWSQQENTKTTLRLALPIAEKAGR